MIDFCCRLSSWTLRLLLVRPLQSGIEARLAHGAGFAAVALREAMAAGRAIEFRAGHRLAA